MTPFERQVRAAVYQSFRDTGDGPDVEDLSTTLSASSDDVRTALRALAAEHCLVLKPGTDDIWMAHPFSAVPTDFVVTIGERRFFANCGWDAFAILAMLGEGAFETHCRATKVPLRFEAKSGIVQGAGILHFLVPPPPVLGRHRIHVSEHRGLPVGRRSGAVARADRTAEGGGGVAPDGL